MVEQHYYSQREDFTVNTCVIETASSSLSRIPTLYSDSIAKIQKITEQLLDKQNWKGKARDEFRDTYRIVERELEDDQEQISSMGEMLKAFQDIYDTIDTDSAKQLREVVSDAYSTKKD